MPRFFYTVVFATFLAWIGVLFVGSQTLPDSTAHIVVFMLGVFIAMALTISVLAFLFFNARASVFMNRHLLYRKSLKYGFFASFCILGVLVLRALQLGSIINYTLFGLLCLILYGQLKSKRL